MSISICSLSPDAVNFVFRYIFSKSPEDIYLYARYSCGSVSSICCVVECVVHPAHHTLPCLLLPRQDPSQPPRTAHALSNTGTGAQLELDTHGAGACCRRGGEVERSPAVHPEQLIVTQARDNPPLRCSLASQSETLALFHNQLYCSTLCECLDHSEVINVMQNS